jgi:NADPH:quinone reductase-like Zn-dependent oxidoreductase
MLNVVSYASREKIGETTRAWVLRRGSAGEEGRGKLECETLTLPSLVDDQILVETLYGSWEANMSHAIDRNPIDVCKRLGQDYIVLGNSGVLRVLRVGRDVSSLQEGDICLLAPMGKEDSQGYLKTIWAFDEPRTMGTLAERFYVPPRQLVRVPKMDAVPLLRWANFSVRYVSAWSNWIVAYGAWRLQMADVPPEKIHVWGWGGGVAYAELLLARAAGCQVAMLCGMPDRLEIVRTAGIEPIDRTAFPDLTRPFDPRDRRALATYLRSERAFIGAVEGRTEGEGVSIFIDNIGGPALRPTLRALGRQGVIATAGWKKGAAIEFNRAIECIGRHTHVHTHACPLREGLDALEFALKTGWIPPEPERVYSWEEIPEMADDYSEGRIISYFPVFATAAARHS